MIGCDFLKVTASRSLVSLLDVKTLLQDVIKTGYLNSKEMHLNVVNHQSLKVMKSQKIV